MNDTTIHTFERSIEYDRETRDYRATLDGDYIGHFSTFHAAEVMLDRVAFDLIADGMCLTATQLDGAQS